MDIASLISGSNPASTATNALAAVAGGPFSGGHSGNTGGSIGGDSFFGSNDSMAAAFFGSASYDQYSTPYGAGIDPKINVPGLGMTSKLLLGVVAVVVSIGAFLLFGKK